MQGGPWHLAGLSNCFSTLLLYGSHGVSEKNVSSPQQERGNDLPLDGLGWVLYPFFGCTWNMMWLVGAHHCTHSDLWYVMAYLISNMIFAICKYFLPFDGRPWHRFEWLAHSDMGLTAKWLCQPGKCFQLPHPSPPKKKHIPKWAQQGFKHRCGCTCCACMYA